MTSTKMKIEKGQLWRINAQTKSGTILYLILDIVNSNTVTIARYGSYSMGPGAFCIVTRSVYEIRDLATEIIV